ncbi:hypothetical protein [Ralstonia solanacearum]|uniref:hypothetical protein n=1 Tax=Ralstonia solanacearum TaxID=305 RepID=UPI0012D742AB|nr:hypothetical protein [Ralstonia solanacearum]
MPTADATPTTLAIHRDILVLRHEDMNLRARLDYYSQVVLPLHVFVRLGFCHSLPRSLPI